MNPRELIRSTAETFRAAGIPDPDTDAALLLSHLLRRPPLELRLDTDTELDSAVLDAFAALAGRRAERVPVQYLLNESPFYRRMFHVDTRVLIPRPETELLCEWALSVISGLSSPRVLDLCCGSGCIGLTVKAERPDAIVTLSDISRDALDVAAANAARYSLQVSLRCGDLAEGLPPAFLTVLFPIRRTFLPRNAAFCSRRFCMSLPLRWTAVPTEWIFTAVFPMNASGSSGRMESCCSSSDTANRTRCLPCSPQPVLPESR